MANCKRCGSRFNVKIAREEFNDRFDHELDYDDYYDGWCASCAISDAESNMNTGIAIDMMNGDAGFDQDFVNRWL